VKGLIIPAHKDHIDYLAGHLRKADVEECAACGLGPREALEQSLEASIAAWTAMEMPPALSPGSGDPEDTSDLHAGLSAGGKPVCMFGVTLLDALAGMGCPWLLGTDDLRGHGPSLARLTKPYLARMLDIFPLLAGWIDVRQPAVKWLKWVGFEVDRSPVPFGPYNMPFYRFEMRRV